MTHHPDRWPDVASAVAERMSTLGLFDNASLIRASGLSEPFVRGMVSGQPRGAPRKASVARLCRALGWTDDSVDRILRGELPQPFMEPSTPSVAASEELAQQVAAHARRIEQLEADVERLLILGLSTAESVEAGELASVPASQPMRRKRHA